MNFLFSQMPLPKRVSGDLPFQLGKQAAAMGSSELLGIEEIVSNSNCIGIVYKDEIYGRVSFKLQSEEQTRV